jgi:hypothetical protein
VAKKFGLRLLRRGWREHACVEGMPVLGVEVAECGEAIEPGVSDALDERRFAFGLNGLTQRFDEGSLRR